MTIKALIEVLNNLTSGELGRMSARVREVRHEAASMGLEEVVRILDDALASLDACDLKGFRKKLQHAVSRLGHAVGATGGARSAPEFALSGSSDQPLRGRR